MRPGAAAEFHEHCRKRGRYTGAAAGRGDGGGLTAIRVRMSLSFSPSWPGSLWGRAPSWPGVSPPPTHRRAYTLRDGPIERGRVAGTRPPMAVLGRLFSHDRLS